VKVTLLIHLEIVSNYVESLARSRSIPPAEALRRYAGLVEARAASALQLPGQIERVSISTVIDAEVPNDLAAADR
jgi:hypothetical protein